MPYEHRLTGLLVERALRDGYIVSERGRRVLHDRDCVAGLPQDLVDASQPEPSTNPPWTRTMLDTTLPFSRLTRSDRRSSARTSIRGDLAGANPWGCMTTVNAEAAPEDRHN
jgi:hypothetical protein